MATRVAIFFDCNQELKDELELKFDKFKTNWGEIYRELSRELLERPQAEIKRFLLKAREHDLDHQEAAKPRDQVTTK